MSDAPTISTLQVNESWPESPTAQSGGIPVQGGAFVITGSAGRAFDVDALVIDETWAESPPSITTQQVSETWAESPPTLTTNQVDESWE